MTLTSTKVCFYKKKMRRAVRVYIRLKKLPTFRDDTTWVPQEMTSEGQAQKYHEREPGNEVEYHTGDLRSASD